MAKITEPVMKVVFNSFILLSLLLTSTSASAFENSRSEKWAFFLAPTFINSKSLQFDNGATADINERSSLGFGIGYNLNLNIELSLMFSTANGNYVGTRIEDGTNTPQRFTANMYTSSINFGFTYNILKGPFTPFISANLGTNFIDSGIPTGNISTGCWWDPWWGYTCYPIADTYSSTEFSYGAGAGLRYDFNRKLYVKGGVTQNYLDISSTNTADFTSWQLIFGFMF